MSAALRGAIAATVLGLTLSLGACGGRRRSRGRTIRARRLRRSHGPAGQPRLVPAGHTGVAVGTSPGNRDSSSFGVGDWSARVVTRVSPLLVLLDGTGGAGSSAARAYEKVKVGDRVIVQITKTDGRFEATLVHVSTKL